MQNQYLGYYVIHRNKRKKTR